MKHRKLSKKHEFNAELKWKRAETPGIMPYKCDIFMECSGRYNVIVTSEKEDMQGALHASIRAADNHFLSWREKFDIKNSLFGSESEAFEIYPKESELVDITNAYHIYIIPKGKTIAIVEEDKP